jgi:hypothetical protein
VASAFEESNQKKIRAPQTAGGRSLTLRLHDREIDFHKEVSGTKKWNPKTETFFEMCTMKK